MLVNNVLSKRTDYKVNDSGMLTEVKGYSSASESIAETYQYDASGIYLASTEIDSLKESYQYDIMGNVTSHTDRKDNSTEFTYDALGRLLTTTKPDKSVVRNEYYDKENWLITTDESGSRFKYIYDGFGFILKSEDLTTSKCIGEVTYDGNRNLSSDTDANGHTVSYKYDALDRPTALSKSDYEELYSYEVEKDGTREIKVIKGDANAPDIKTSVYMDKYGRKEFKSAFLDGTEIKTGYQYDYLGNVTSFLNPQDKAEGRTYTTKYEYGLSSDPIKTIDALCNEIKTDYDFLGRKIAVTDTKGKVFRYEYNSFGQLMLETLPFESNAKSTKKYVYDSNGNMISLSVAVNKPGEAEKLTTTINLYNNLNQLTRTISGGICTEYTYDERGNQTAVITASGAKKTAYEYDHLNRLVKLTDALGQEESYVYDGMGNLLSKTDRNGNTIKNTYDSLNNLTEVHAETANGTADEFIKYTYSKNNLLLHEGNGNLLSSYQYDSLGRIKTILDSTAVKKDYKYDLNNNRTEFTLSINGIEKSKLTYTYDVLGRLQKVQNKGKEEAFYTYDKNGNRSYMRLGNGIETSYSYNDANLVKTLDNKQGGTVVSSYAYTYFLDGNQASKTDHMGMETCYVYDYLGRLQTEQQTGTEKNITWEYEYDKAHNRSKMMVTENGQKKVTDYTYDANNRLLRENRYEQETGIQTLSAYGYDKNGNQISKMTDVIKPP